MKAHRFIFFVVLTILFLGCKETQSTAERSDNAANDSSAEVSTTFNVVFYNVENLFDTEDDPQKADEEFTPAGEKEWTPERYDQKLAKLSRVIAASDDKLPAVIGLCEVENRKVVEDLAKTGALAAIEYGVIHRESPDGRGIDVALLYDTKRLNLNEAGVITTTLPVGDRPNTRLILHASGDINGAPVHFFVNHWPSRYGGKEKSEPNRLAVASNLRTYLDAVLQNDPDAEIIMMGDFNDHPDDKSIVEVLNAGSLSSSQPLANLMYDLHKKGKGSYNYRGEWGALDQFIVTRSLTDGEGIDVQPETVRFVRHDWMMYVNDKGEAYPNRTYGGPNYYGGFSDHLPIVATFSVY